jgi:hypothetical protein
MAKRLSVRSSMRRERGARRYEVFGAITSGLLVAVGGGFGRPVLALWIRLASGDACNTAKAA